MKKTDGMKRLEEIIEEVKRNPEAFLVEMQKDLQERRLRSGFSIEEIAQETGCSIEEILGQENGTARFKSEIYTALNLFYFDKGLS